MSTPAPDTEFVQLQDAAVAALAADALFAPVAPAKRPAILHERIGDIVSKIETGLGRLGLVLVVLTPLARLPEPEVDTLTLDVPLIVQITENVLLNQAASGTRIAALTAVRAVMRVLHHRPHGVTAGSPRVCRFQLTETPFTLVEQDPVLTYHVNLTAHLTLS